jgi:hypothetical protein
MDGAAVTDLILRAIAALRERGELPEVEHPSVTVTRLASETLAYRSNAGAAIAAAQPDDRQSARDLAHAIAAYLAEVVDLVPAYHEVRAIMPADDGTITIFIGSSDNN